MIALPNGCTCSELTVSPKDWKTCKASGLGKSWHIHYYFYDNTLKERKYIKVKGMNRFKTLEERREATKQLIENELYQLKEKGFNAITGKFLAPQVYGINPQTRFIDALRQACDLLKIEQSTKWDLHSVINFIETASIKLGIDKMEIHLIKRRHLKQALEICGELKKKWSAYSYNNYRGYLMMLFKKLLEEDAVETNPVKDIFKQKSTFKIQNTLSLEERLIIDNYLKTMNPDFRRFVHIFFHSGSRKTELCRLKVKDVNLEKQVFKLLIKKGNQYREVLRPIKDVALDFWIEQLEGASPEDFVFSLNFRPGRINKTPKWIANMWKRYVKEGLGIDINFYSLKHLNLDETSSILDAKAASKMAGHTSTVVTLKHYLVNEEERQREKLKKVHNEFA